MLTLRFIEKKDGFIHYEYYPEDDKNNPGKVSIAIDTREKRVNIESIKDLGGKYAFKALKRIEEYINANEYKDNDLVAWC